MFIIKDTMFRRNHFSKTENIEVSCIFTQQLNRFIILLMLVLVSISIFADEEIVHLRLGTASKEGNYFPLGVSISSLIDSAQTDFIIEVIETKGSVDNIEKLSQGQIDLAIVQNDICFFAENGLEPFTKDIRNLVGIMSLYLEPIYLLTNDSSFNDLTKLINNKVNVGPIGSGLHIDAKIILNSQNLWSNTIKKYDSPINGIDELVQGNINAAFTNVIPESQKQCIINGDVSFIPISSSIISKLEKTYPYFTTCDINESGVIDFSQKTIAVKSLLICHKDLDKDIIFNLTKLIYENIETLDFPLQRISRIREDIVKSMSLKEFHPGSKKYLQDIGILRSQSLFRYLWLVLFIITSVICIVVLLNVILIPKSFRTHRYVSLNTKMLRSITSLHNFVSQHKYLFILICVLTAYFTVIIFVKRIEHNWAIQHNLISNFDNQSFKLNLLWMFIFGSSGYNDNLFPSSPLAKFLVTFIPLIGIGGFLSMVGFLTSDNIKNRLLKARGVRSKMFKDHISLCGWNKNVPYIINNLMHQNILYKKPIVVLAEVDDEYPLKNNNINHDLVTYVRGHATNKNDLDRANIREADIAIIIADSNSSEPDATSILKILTIEKYGHELEEQGKRKNRENIYTIAEIQNADNFQTAYDAHVDEIISLENIKSKILVQSILNPGVSKVINEILTYNEFNDIYSINLDRKSSLIEYTFDEILVKLRENNILLLSISIGNHKSRKEQLVIQKKYGLNRTVLTNPITQNELSYKTKEGDILIVLAQYEKTIKNALKAIS